MLRTFLAGGMPLAALHSHKGTQVKGAAAHSRLLSVDQEHSSLDVAPAHILILSQRWCLSSVQMPQTLVPEIVQGTGDTKTIQRRPLP